MSLIPTGSGNLCQYNDCWQQWIELFYSTTIAAHETRLCFHVAAVASAPWFRRKRDNGTCSNNEKFWRQWVCSISLSQLPRNSPTVGFAWLFWLWRYNNTEMVLRSFRIVSFVANIPHHNDLSAGRRSWIRIPPELPVLFFSQTLGKHRVRASYITAVSGQNEIKCSSPDPRISSISATVFVIIEVYKKCALRTHY